MITLNLEKEYTAYWVIGAINRALGDEWNFTRPTACPEKILNGSKNVQIKVHEKKPYNIHKKEIGVVIYTLSFLSLQKHIGEDPRYAKSKQFEIKSERLDFLSLEQRILEEIKR